MEPFVYVTGGANSVPGAGLFCVKIAVLVCQSHRGWINLPFSSCVMDFLVFEWQPSVPKKYIKEAFSTFGGVEGT